MSILVFVHVLLMFAAVTTSVGPTLVLLAALRSGKTEDVRGVLIGAQRVGRIIPILYVAGALAGLAAAVTGSINLLAPWLLIAYVLFAEIAVVGGLVFGPWTARAASAAVAAPNGPYSAPLAALLADQRVRTLVWVDIAVIALIIFDMVVKPFS